MSPNSAETKTLSNEFTFEALLKLTMVDDIRRKKREIKRFIS
jgi:hypothetical protein